MKNNISIIVITILFLLNGTVNASEIEEEVNSNIDILCPNKVDRRVIQKTESSLWCDIIFSEICDKDQMIVARKICTTTYKNRLKRLKKSTSETKPLNKQTPKEKTPYELELQELEFEQKRIELRQRELDLLKKELELQKKEQSLIRS